MCIADIILFRGTLRNSQTFVRIRESYERRKIYYVSAMQMTYSITDDTAIATRFEQVIPIHFVPLR